MTDMFDELIWCKDCRTEMKRVLVNKNGFNIRALQCPKCGKRIYHPNDIEEFKKFAQLKQKPFDVKLRMVGNSYAVSIPREIIDFMQESNEEEKNSNNSNHHVFDNDKLKDKMNEMVRLCLEDAGRISLSFGKEITKIEQRDSLNPEKNKSIIISKAYSNDSRNKENPIKYSEEVIVNGKKVKSISNIHQNEINKNNNKNREIKKPKINLKFKKVRNDGGKEW